MVASTTVSANSRVDDSPVSFLVQSPVHLQEQPHKSSLPPCAIPDIYGQVHPVETDELISSSLRKFDLAVNLLRNDVVAVAERKCPHLLTPSFKLLFLRCEVFHVDVSVWTMGQELCVVRRLSHGKLYNGFVAVGDIQKIASCTALRKLLGTTIRSVWTR
jgi:hypothetical protein